MALLGNSAAAALAGGLRDEHAVSGKYRTETVQSREKYRSFGSAATPPGWDSAAAAYSAGLRDEDAMSGKYRAETVQSRDKYVPLFWRLNNALRFPEGLTDRRCLKKFGDVHHFFDVIRIRINYVRRSPRTGKWGNESTNREGARREW